MSELKPLEWRSLPTYMDLRSPPDQVPWGVWRYSLNMWCPDDNHWDRRPGWLRLGFDRRNGVNSDLHSRTDTRPIDSFHTHTGRDGSRFLLSATRGTVYFQHRDGRQRVLGTVNPGGRMAFTSFGDAVVITGGGDVPKYHLIGASDPALQDVPGISDIGLTRARGTFTWGASVFFFDVVMDGVRATNRLVWCGANDISVWGDAEGQSSGFMDLGQGETILAAVPMTDHVLILTDKGAWRMTVATGDIAFGFQNIYPPKTHDRCLAGRNAWTKYGDSVLYWSDDGFMVFSSYAIEPQRVDWMWRACKRWIPGDCSLISAAFYAPASEAWFSTPSGTIVFGLDDECASEVDAGFHALHTMKPDTEEELAEWMVRVAGCSSAHVAALFPETADALPASGGFNAECSDDMIPECSECRGPEVLILSAAADGCLKQFDPETYARETYISGIYTLVGYPSRLLTGCGNFGNAALRKKTDQVDLDFIAPPTDTPRSITLKVWSSATPVDVLDPGCNVKGVQLSAKSLACPYAPNGDQPHAHVHWSFEYGGRYLTFDFNVASTTGGAFSLSRFAAYVGLDPVNSQ